MTGASMLLPLIGVVLGVCVAGGLRRWLSPQAATRLLTIVAVSSAIAIGWGLILIVFAWTITYSEFSDVAGWCEIATPGHHPVGTAIGVGSLVMLVVGTIRATTAAYGFRRMDADWRHGDEIEILATAEPVAFAVPGDPGSVVVSTGLLQGLEQRECDAVLAHEHAHLAHRHHRYVRWTRIATAAVPLLWPLDRWVAISTERWADEEAARLIGDRKAVASALVATATAQARVAGVLQFNGSHLGERVEALVNPRRPHPYVVGCALVVVWVAVGATLLSNSVQLHHLASFAEHICTTHG